MPEAISSYLGARINVLASELIRIEQIQSLVDADLDDLLHHIGLSVDSGLDDNAIEKQLVSDALEDFQLLFRPFYSVERDLLNYGVHWYELTNLKTLIRGKFTGKSDSSIQKQLINLDQFAVLPLQRLLQADDPHEMLRLLEQTPYSNIVRQARTIYEKEGQNLFALDAAIDRHFFTGLLQRIRFLDQQDRQEMLLVFGSLMDRLNLLWLLRYRFSYGLSPAKSFYLLATTGRKLHSENLMGLARLDTIGEVIEQLPAPLDRLLKDTSNLTEIENLMEHYMLQAATKGLKRSVSTITRVFSYVLLRESQIHFLQAVIKGKLHGFETRLIDKALGGTASHV